MFRIINLIIRFQPLQRLRFHEIDIFNRNMYTYQNMKDHSLISSINSIFRTRINFYGETTFILLNYHEKKFLV